MSSVQNMALSEPGIDPKAHLKPSIDQMDVDTKSFEFVCPLHHPPYTRVDHL